MYFNMKKYEEIDAIGGFLYRSAMYDLTTEVVWSALKALKENPKLEIAEAMEIGYNEWVK